MKIVYIPTLLFCLYFSAAAQDSENITNMNRENGELINSFDRTKTPMLGLRTAVYKVPDIAKAKDWYSAAFQTKPYFDEPFYVGFNIAGYELGLLPEETEVRNKTDNTLSYWGVEDIQRQFYRLIELGATEHEKPSNYGGDLMIASVRDPWGNVVGLIYNPYFKLTEDQKDL